MLLPRKPESVGLLSATLHRNIIPSVILCMGMKLGLSQEGKTHTVGSLVMLTSEQQIQETAK